MEAFFERMIKHKRMIIIIFIALTALCGLLSRGVSVNYNFFDYLPDNAPSTIALDVMSEEYAGGIPNTRIMVKDVTVPQALSIKAQLKEIEGVISVNWLDDSINIYAPLESAAKKTVESFYKDGHALFSLTVDDEKKLVTLDVLRETLEGEGLDCAFIGSAVNTAEATKSSGSEVGKITMLVIPICFIILLLTTSSWFEPVLFMVTIGIAVVLNRGTNLFIGEISFVTNAAGSILQLAVSMDYSIFLLHRFADYRAEGYDVTSAMIKALKSAFSTITASGITTVIGFAALILMRFKIGPDMGIVMAKAIVLSMISVLVLLPVLTLVSYKLIDKTHHRSLLPGWGWLARLSHRIKAPAAIVFILVLVPAYLAQNANDFYYGASSMFSEGTRIIDERNEVEAVFGRANQMVLLVPNGDVVREKQLSDELHSTPGVTGIISYVDMAGAEIPMEYIDKSLLSQLVSENYSRMLLTVSTDYEGEEAFSLVTAIKDVSAKYYGEDYLLAGDSVNTYDLKNVVTEDMLKVNLVAIGAVFIVLLLTMRSITLPIILVLTIESAIFINLSFPYFGNQYIFYIAYLIISSIQLGATVDYAILLTNRYLTERGQHTKKQALINTLTGTSLSILTSAGILALGGLVLGFISTNGVLSQLGTFIGRGALLSLAMVLLVLPALLWFCDRIIEKTTKACRFVKEYR